LIVGLATPLRTGHHGGDSGIFIAGMLALAGSSGARVGPSRGLRLCPRSAVSRRAIAFSVLALVLVRGDA